MRGRLLNEESGYHLKLISAFSKKPFRILERIFCLKTTLLSSVIVAAIFIETGQVLAHKNACLRLQLIFHFLPCQNFEIGHPNNLLPSLTASTTFTGIWTGLSARNRMPSHVSKLKYVTKINSVSLKEALSLSLFKFGISSLKHLQKDFTNVTKIFSHQRTFISRYCSKIALKKTKGFMKRIGLPEQEIGVEMRGGQHEIHYRVRKPQTSMSLLRCIRFFMENLTRVIPKANMEKEANKVMRIYDYRINGTELTIRAVLIKYARLE